MSAATAEKIPEPEVAEDRDDLPPWKTDPHFYHVREVLRGEVLMSPRPAPAHAKVSSALAVYLIGPYDYGEGGGPGSWLLLYEPELHLGTDVVVPDLAGWHRERMPTLPAEAYFAVAPDFVCEILSPRTADYDRAEKLEIYAEHGVRHVWLVDPLLRTLEVYRLGEGGHYVLLKTYRGGREVRPEPFDALALDLRKIWPS